jgi:GH43 family beta-xylosidase
MLYDGYFADPFVTRTNEGYVALGTRPAPPAPEGGLQFEVLSSEDLKHWSYRGGALIGLDPSLGDQYWAPEVIHAEGWWWMYYSVGRGIEGHHLRVARSHGPYGPYEDLGLDLTPGESFAIDAHPFIDVDGTAYLFFARDVVEGERPGTHLALAPLEDMTRLGPASEVLRPYADWQIYERSRLMYGGVHDWHTLEGPSVVRRSGRYWMTFSGGAWTGRDYAVSWAVADDPRGPWRPAPASAATLLQTDDHLIGPGHNSLVVGPDGGDVIAFHAWDAALSRRELHLRQIEFRADGPTVGGPI